MKKPSPTNACIAVAAVVLGGVASIRPWQAYFHQRSETNLQIQNMKSYERDRANLLRQEAQESRPTVREERARALGFIPRGEQPAPDK